MAQNPDSVLCPWCKTYYKLKTKQNKNNYKIFLLVIIALLVNDTNSVASLIYSYIQDSLTNTEQKKFPVEIEDFFKDMKFIPEGTFTMGNMGFLKAEPKDSLLLLWNLPFRVSVSSFLISETEITNKQYKKFINWVRDSVSKTLKVNNIKIEKIIYNFSNSEEGIAIYPDTSVWTKDSRYSFLESMESQYFQNPAYDNFPVVGITWLQANEYCKWKSRQLIELLKKHNINISDFVFSLPTEAEWEYAAKEAMVAKQENLSERRKYPWKGHQLTNNKGAYYSNYGQSIDINGVVIKEFSDDGNFALSEVKKYQPNDAGLYDMAGNAAEWVMDVARKIRLQDWMGHNPDREIVQAENHQIISDDNPHSLLNKIIKYTMMIPGAEKYDTLTLYRKEILLDKANMMLHDWRIMNGTSRKHIVKGGSWADSPAYLLCASRQIYDETKASSKIGFRIVVRLTEKNLPYFNH